MNFFQRRRYRKLVKHMIHEAGHVVNMRGDLLAAAQRDELRACEESLRSAWAARNEQAVQEGAEELAACMERLNPPRSHAKVREYVEVIAVAVAVAMAFRTYFIQPFKIPTGSMQPTLFGITVKPQYEAGFMDRFPLKLLSWALFGERYVEVKARVAGRVEHRYATDEESIVFFIDGVPHPVRRDMVLFFSQGDFVAKGQVMASGRVRLGDHIFVDKVRYNFSRPKRGDITVFSTDGINYPRIRPDSFYIKRMAALPGEEVAIQPPYLRINGANITDPYPFRRLLEERDRGYQGYTLAKPQDDAEVFIGQAGRVKKLCAGDYLMLGDNTEHSYDSRYFGAVRQEDLVGPAFMVYWPFSRRWGRVQ